MSDLSDLYLEVVIDHGRRPRNFHPLQPHSHEAQGYNPLCGDQLQLFLQVTGNRIADISFTGTGCAISTASASLMTEALKGKSVKDAEALFTEFHNMLTDTAEPDLDKLDKLAVLSGVNEYPTRVKCATLAWHTLKAALHGDASAKTE